MAMAGVGWLSAMHTVALGAPPSTRPATLPYAENEKWLAELSDEELPPKKRAALRLLFACERGDLATVKALLAAGTDINGKLTPDQNPLSWAVCHRQKDVVAFLLAKGANVNPVMVEPDFSDLSPLDLALGAKPMFDVARMLRTESRTAM